MNSDPQARVHPFKAWVVIPIYMIVGLGTTLLAFSILSQFVKTAFTYQGFLNYCTHNNPGEGLAFVAVFGWPFVLLQIGVSLAIGRALPRTIKLVANFSLPAAVVIALSPCFT